MSQTMWFLTRASGIVALVLILAAVADGLIFSGREGGRRLRPAWWLDLHRGLGGYALIFTGLHVLTAFASSDLGVGLADIVVPGASSTDTAAFTWGVLALYGLVLTVLSSWPTRRFSRRVWHVVHLVSVPVAVGAAVHAYQLGSDARTPQYTVAFLVALSVTMYAVGLRLSSLVRRRHSPSFEASPTP